MSRSHLWVKGKTSCIHIMSVTQLSFLCPCHIAGASMSYGHSSSFLDYFYVNCLLADDSHEKSYFLWKQYKKCRLRKDCFDKC